MRPKRQLAHLGWQRAGLLFWSVLFIYGQVWAGEKPVIKKSVNKTLHKTKKPKKIFDTKPIETTSAVRWSHAPFEMGECDICHVSNDRKDPGALRTKGQKLCLDCHVQMAQTIQKGKQRHKFVIDDCSYCHNPHNSQQKQLLYVPLKQLCQSCHADVVRHAQQSKVRHEAVNEGRACSNCHTPHASYVKHLLRSLPSDQCIQCHGKDGLKDDKGRLLDNFAKLLSQNPVHHSPIDKKDCSACHDPHGSDYYRLLRAAHPAQFYAPFTKKTYSLCFSCHNIQSVTKPKTTTLTGFRDGDRNLHFLHVNKSPRGRTCRSCHESHATKQKHLIRDSVPYGKSGWKLHLNFELLPTGGRCSKTCHNTREYNNSLGKD